MPDHALLQLAPGTYLTGKMSADAMRAAAKTRELEEQHALGCRTEYMKVSDTILDASSTALLSVKAPTRTDFPVP